MGFGRTKEYSLQRVHKKNVNFFNGKVKNGRLLAFGEIISYLCSIKMIEGYSSHNINQTMPYEQF